MTDQEKKLIRHFAQDAKFFAAIVEELIHLRLEIDELKPPTQRARPKLPESEGL